MGDGRGVVERIKTSMEQIALSQERARRDLNPRLLRVFSPPTALIRWIGGCRAIHAAPVKVCATGPPTEGVRPKYMLYRCTTK